MTMKRFIMLIICVMIVPMILLKPIQIVGSSMSPTLMDGDWVVLSRYSYSIVNPKRRDIIVYRGEDNLLKVKRIAGMPQDFVGLLPNGAISVNAIETSNSIWVPNNKYFVIGDNKINSIDSRSKSVKYIDKKDILGKIIYKW